MKIYPVFIVGNSRSGTTLLARIFSKHSAVHILKETHFMASYEEQRKCYFQLKQQDRIRLLNLLLTVENKGVNYKDEYPRYSDEAKHIYELCPDCSTFSSLLGYFFNYSAIKNGKAICGDQTPSHVFYTKEILELFPNAKFINIVRDPRAVLLSQKNKWKAAKKMKQPLKEVLRAFFNYHPITTSLLWRKGVEAGRKAQNELPPNVFYTLKFEQLLHAPETVLNELCTFIQVEFENDMLDVNVAMSSNETDEGKKGIRLEVINHWRRRLSETEIFISERINGVLAEEEGYQLVNAKRGLFSLLYHLCYFPLHLAILIPFNMKRMRNPISYISRRFL